MRFSHRGEEIRRRSACRPEERAPWEDPEMVLFVRVIRLIEMIDEGWTLSILFYSKMSLTSSNGIGWIDSGSHECFLHWQLHCDTRKGHYHLCHLQIIHENGISKLTGIERQWALGLKSEPRATMTPTKNTCYHVLQYSIPYHYRSFSSREEGLVWEWMQWKEGEQRPIWQMPSNEFLLQKSPRDGTFHGPVIIVWLIFATFKTSQTLIPF